MLGVYKIQSKIKPDRVYIGSAVDIKSRWRIHKHHLFKNKHHSKKLQRHFNKYGLDDLKFEVLVECDNDVLIKKEQCYVNIFQPYFNCSPTAGSQLGFKHSKSTREKCRCGRLGKTITEWHKQQISKASKGHIVTDEMKMKISIKNTGRKQSEELKKWRSDFFKGKKQSIETIEKRRLKLIGKKRTQEQKNNIWIGRRKALLNKTNT